MTDLAERLETRAAVRHLKRASPELKSVIERIGPLDIRARPGTPFQSLLRAIVGQQLSGKAAATIHGRMVELFPNKRAVTAKNLQSIADEDLRGAGLSRNKLASVRDLAKNVLAGNVPGRAKLQRLPDNEIIERLTAVRGIGTWTVQMMLMFYLLRPDVLPIDDLGIQKGYADAFGTEKPKPKQLLELCEGWRPYRTVASCYLWRGLDG